MCSKDGTTNFISACHAGCSEVGKINNTKVYSHCSCITPKEFGDDITISGSCPVDCYYKFYLFVAVVCLLKFTGATGRVSNFLVTVRYIAKISDRYIISNGIIFRCVEEKDKPVAMGFGLMMMSLCAFVPSPILFGTIIG